jgi:DNA-binding GntR family transcriptional regulator
MFQPGEAVPSITDLAADRGWSRQTCSRAMRILAKEGRLTFYPGSGYHVSGPAEENVDSSDDQSNGANEASDNAAWNAGAVDRSQRPCA